MTVLNNLTGLPAILVALTAAIMWGTWFISLKHLKEYPIEAFYVVMFAFCLIFVWGLSLLLEGREIFDNIYIIYLQAPAKIFVTLLGGILYAAGIWVSLKVMDKIGLTLSQPLLQSITLIAGVLVTLCVGGRPDTLTDAKIVLTVFCLLGAAIFGLFGRSRAEHRNPTERF